MSSYAGEKFPPIIVDALCGTRGEDQKRIAEHGLKWLTMILKKNNDYGSSAWKAPVLIPDAQPREAILVRMSDKIERLAVLYSRSVEASKVAEVNESYDDTIGDLGAYCLLYLAAPIGGQHDD